MPIETRDPRSFGQVKKGVAEIPEIADDYYVAKLIDVKESTSTFDGEERDQFTLEWKLKDVRKANGELLTLRSWVAIPDGLINDGILNENSNLYGLLMALGYDDENLEVVPEDWMEKTVRINVENKKIASGQNAGQIRPRITGYKPLKDAPVEAKRVGSPKGAAKPADESGDDF